jgi:AraC-like DNA-binding protein
MNFCANLLLGIFTGNRSGVLKFDTYIPCDILKPFVRKFVISEEAEENSYRVLPDTGVVIGFQYQGRLSQIVNGSENVLAASGVTGINGSYRIFKNSAGIGTVLIFFKEGGAAEFFRHPVHELFQQSLSLDNFMLSSELVVLEEQLYETQKDAERIAVVEQFLISRMRQIEPDHLVVAAVTLIRQNKGNIRIKTLIERLNISQSPLEKRFRQLIGTSPKKFASIVRFKYALEHYQPQCSLTDLGYHSGFYDQAHFIKEFKTFTGETPEQYFKKE